MKLLQFNVFINYHTCMPNFDYFSMFQDDPEAHDNFLKINRAYEVLKDEDMRKKFDMHGEEGLKDDFHGGNRYESWKFYQEEFGKFSFISSEFASHVNDV